MLYEVITKQRLILASGSPRRKEYLENAGIEFSVVPATIDESRRHAESIDEYVRRMALEKGYSVASRFVRITSYNVCYTKLLRAHQM